MRDDEILKALDSVGTATGVVLGPHSGQTDIIADRFRELIDENNRQKAEIERLKKKANTPFAKITFDRDELQEIVDEYVKNIEININLAKSEAMKEFAERLKDEMRLEDDCQYDCMNCLYECKGYVLIIDNLVKEMTEQIENE